MENLNLKSKIQKPKSRFKKVCFILLFIGCFSHPVQAAENSSITVIGQSYSDNGLDIPRLNRELGPKGAAAGFHSAVIELESKSAAASVIQTVEALGLEVRDGGARRAAYVMSALLAAISLVGAVVLAVSALHVMHVFALLAMIRRREIGVMRAVGASRGDIRQQILTEASVIGIAAGCLGLGIARSIAWFADRGLGSAVPDFPFNPETFFSFDPRLVAASLGLAMIACVLGAIGPSLRATGPDPAEVLSGD